MRFRRVQIRGYLDIPPQPSEQSENALPAPDGCAEVQSAAKPAVHAKPVYPPRKQKHRKRAYEKEAALLASRSWGSKDFDSDRTTGGVYNYIYDI